ncbi:MAG: super-infection exclusion protein B [Candidatus Paceibacterota bacterium]
MKIPDWLEAIKLRPLYLAAIFLSGVLLLNKNVASRFGLTDFIQQYATWIGFITLLAGVFWITHAVHFLTKSIKNKIEFLKYRKTVIYRIATLSLSEKILLFVLVQTNTQTVTAPITNSVVHSLCSKGIMCSASGTGNSLKWPSSIKDWVWEYLRENSDKIFTELHKLNPEEIQDRLKQILDLFE